MAAFGGEMNLKKTEWMCIAGGGVDTDAVPLPGCKILRVRGQPIPRTAQFCYVGSMLGTDETLGVQSDVKRRIGLACAAFGLLKHVWRSRQVSLAIKVRMLLTCVATVLLFGAECWTLAQHEKKQLRKT